MLCSNCYRPCVEFEETLYEESYSDDTVQSNVFHGILPVRSDNNWLFFFFSKYCLFPIKILLEYTFQLRSMEDTDERQVDNH